MDLARVSCCTYPLRERPALEAMEVIAAAGFTKIDLLGRMPHLSLDPAECDPMARKIAAEKLGLRVANLGTYVGKGFASDDRRVQEAALEELERAVDVAVVFGARSIRVSPGDETEACLDRIVPWFRAGATYAASQGIYLGFENHGGGISNQPALCKMLADKVGSRHFGVLYEPYNLMYGGTDYRFALETFRDHIVHVHLKDGKMTWQGFERTMMGEGEIDYRWVRAQLEALGYEGDFAFEYELDAPPPEEGLKSWYRTAVAM